MSPAVSPTASNGSRANFRFGPYAVHVAERLLLQDGTPVKIGARAFDLLTVLLENAGSVVSRTQISDRVWAGVIVGETSLRFQIAELRKLLAQAGERVIATIPGRGYCFVLPVAGPENSEGSAPFSSEGALSAPARLSHMVGRDSEAAELVMLLEAHRFLTVVGAGGIGKTTLAIAAAHLHADRSGRTLCFVDLGAVTDPGQVVAACATAAGLAVDSVEPVKSLAAFLRRRPFLIVLDSCEHVIAAAASLAEQLFIAAPDLHIIATSRETLRVEGEHALVLSPFAYPDEGEIQSVEHLMAFPAAQLLVERARAAGAVLSLEDADVAAVAEICRRLDGIALAIELAAGRVPTYGLRGTLALLNDRLGNLSGGRRTALPRHRTLADTLAWSYDLLDHRSRLVLQRLAVFVGEFGLTAVEVVCDDEINEAEAQALIEGLVAKSLVSTKRGGGDVRFRLLDTTRAYLLERFSVSEEADRIHRRHAELYRRIALEESGPHRRLEEPSREVANLRSALDWAFGPSGDVSLAPSLAAAAAPLFLRLSLLSECQDISARGIALLDESLLGSRVELELQTCLGQSLMFTAGNTDLAEHTLVRALALSEAASENTRTFRLLGALHIFHERRAAFGKALTFAQQAFALAEQSGDAAAVAAAHSLLGIAWHLLGRHSEADYHLAHAMSRIADARDVDPTGFGFDHRNRARIAYARSLWLQGRSDDGYALAVATVEESALLDHPVTHSIALIWAISVAEWRENWVEMETWVERFVAHAGRHSLRPYRAVGACMRGQLLIRNGALSAQDRLIDEGVAMIAENLRSLREVSYEMLTTGFLATMAEGLMLTGRLDHALDTIDDCEALVRRHGDHLYLPEILRVRAAIWARKGQTTPARKALQEAMAIAAEQSATAWALKCACDLVDLGEAPPKEVLPNILARYGAAAGDETWRRATALVAGLA